MNALISARTIYSKALDLLTMPTYDASPSSPKWGGFQCEDGSTVNVSLSHDGCVEVRRYEPSGDDRMIRHGKPIEGLIVDAEKVWSRDAPLPPRAPIAVAELSALLDTVTKRFL